MMSHCPHCLELGIPGWRKAILSPGNPVTCERCGKDATFTWGTWLKASLPGTVVMLPSYWIESTTWSWGLGLGGMALMIGAYVYWAPLVKQP